MTDPEALAKSRFMALNLARMSGLIMVFAGIANIGGRLLPDLAPWLGQALLMLGAADFFVAPVLLKRLWTRQDGE